MTAKRRQAGRGWGRTDRYDLELVIGRPFHGFTGGEVRELWEARRDAVMARPRRPGRRPWAWWVFDQGEERPGQRAQVRRLLELGVMPAAEQEAVLRLGERAVREYGLPWRVHGGHPSVDDANAVRVHRGLPLIRFAEDEPLQQQPAEKGTIA